ncbi:MAG: YibE/F family protein [Acidimicrobiales bacterium]
MHADHHDHGDDWSALAGSPVRRVLTAVISVVGVAAVIGVIVWWPRGESEVDRDALEFGERVDATVTEADVGPCTYDPTEECNAVRFRVIEGEGNGTIGSIEASRATDTPAASLEPGDGIVVNDNGADQPAESRFSFADRQRDTSLIVLGLVFAAAVVALGRLRGLLALAGIVVTLAVLVVYVFPALLHGSPPIGVALSGSAVMAYVVLYLAHGISDRTTVALIGTLSSLALTAALAMAFAGSAELSGLASDESISLLAFAPELDFRGLLLAAVIIGALGVLDDVTVTQVSAVWELHRSDPTSTPRQLYQAASRIGRDHIASTVNTLVLAYSAAALPLLLLYTQAGLGVGEVLTNETIAVEIVQTLVGSIGLVASVPMTTALACWVVTRSGSVIRDVARSRDSRITGRNGWRHRRLRRLPESEQVVRQAPT